MVIKDNSINVLRKRRVTECFSIVNRGFLWYNRLSREQLNELEEWYQGWLDAPTTGVVPPAPIWINDKLTREEEEILL